MFKSEERKFAEAHCTRIAAMLQRQIELAIAAAKHGRNVIYSEVDARMRDHIWWGYIFGFIDSGMTEIPWKVLTDNRQRQRYIDFTLKKLFPSFGVAAMRQARAQVDAKFEQAVQNGRDDYTTWLGGEQPKRLTNYLVCGNYDSIEG